MEFGIKIGTPEKQRGACVVVGIFESKKLSESAKILDKVTQGYIKKILTSGDMNGKVNTSLLLHHVPDTLFKRVLLIGLGNEQEFKEKTLQSAVGTVLSALQKTAVTDVTLFLADFPVKARTAAWKVSQIVIQACNGSYRFDQLKSKPENEQSALRKITLCINDRSELAACETALQQGLAIAHGMDFTKKSG